MEVTQADWLNVVSQFATVGHIYPGWLLVKPLPGVVEQDQEGRYYISNEGLGLFAVGFTREEAMADFTISLIGNYQLLEAQASDDPDLQALFQEYQKYLQIEVLSARKRLRKTLYILNHGQDRSEETTLPSGRDSTAGLLAPPSVPKPDSLTREANAEGTLGEAQEEPDRLNPDELTLLISLVAEYGEKPLPQRNDLPEIELLLGKLKRLARQATLGDG